MAQLTQEIIERGRQGELSLLGRAIYEEMERRHVSFQDVVFDYSDLGLNYMLAKSAYIEFRLDQDIYS
ncbi:hypothetical protein [Cobetia sp. 1CM21F]|uniref:hypothetical protein n=1 Tax=Cobetia sp. 1CM21F TaxID=2929163 RepID=UPI0020C009E8|nr:hypothetical protein [Cobetia sp. 1CM21F]MCK8068095.1 hypothetical protein [Cobetia sp. 1CM21F]